MNPSNPSSANPLGVALLAGRLVATVLGSDGHITIRAWAKRKDENSGRWITCKFEDAYLIDLAVPGAEGDWADKIGTWYPAHSSSKWANRYFTDRSQTDDRRVKAALYVLDVAAGVKNGTHVELAKRCLRCSKELTHPDSIETNFGPECIKHVAPWLENRSGTDDAAHLPKEDNGASKLADVFRPAKTDDADVEYGGQPCPHMSHWRDCPICNPPQAQEFVPPKPDFERANTADNDPKPEITNADEELVLRLRAGDDPKAVLAAYDAR